jgi:small subunit ribosomal protein S6
MTMRRYEVVYVLAPTLTQEEVEQYAETYSQSAREQGAEIISVDSWEKRKLAFRVKKYWEGYYTILTIEETAADAVTELERRFKVNDAVIRFLTVRIDEELKRAAKFGEVELKEREEDLDDEEPVRARPKRPAKVDDDEAESPEPEKEKAEKKPVKKAKVQEKEAAPVAADENPAEADSVEKADEEPAEKPEEE